MNPKEHGVSNLSPWAVTGSWHPGDEEHARAATRYSHVMVRGEQEFTRRMTTPPGTQQDSAAEAGGSERMQRPASNLLPAKPFTKAQPPVPTHSHEIGQRSQMTLS